MSIASKRKRNVGIGDWQSGEDLNQTIQLYVDAIINGESPRGRKMLDITHGVMELYEGSDRFEAAVQTDEGPKTLEGKVFPPRRPIDEIQSVPLAGWQPAVQELGRAIRSAYDGLQPNKALKTISMIWEHLDRTGELAAARSRILMGKIDAPKLAELPEWYVNQKPALCRHAEDELPANPMAVETAECLIRAAVAQIDVGRRVEAEVETGPLGRVIIDWDIPGWRVQWMVEAIDLAWPSVKVYQVSYRTSGGNLATRTRIFHNAFDAVEAFVEFSSER